MEERAVVRHFTNHYHAEGGRFVSPLPKKPDAKPIGESRSQAVRRFLSLECSLNSTGKFQDFEAMMQEYLDLGHAEPILTKACCVQKFQYHYKNQSSVGCFSKVCYLNDTLLVGLTVHPPLID